MLDNLREDANSSFPEDHAKFQQAAGTVDPTEHKAGHFLGMTSMQRFIIAVMLMVAVCTLGMMCLLVTGKFGLF